MVTFDSFFETIFSFIVFRKYYFVYTKYDWVKTKYIAITKCYFVTTKGPPWHGCLVLCLMITCMSPPSV